ncbi:MAG: UDP-N-acetylmuramate dehydrogenase [Ruminococcus sp.]|nr:UDP-N-acetylmuramate dehydrogenase [Ruminococcus sp.]
MSLSGLCTLAAGLGCEVRYNEPLSAHTTFKVGGECEAFIEIASADALVRLISCARAEGVKYYVLGKGSNVVFEDRGFGGAVLHIGQQMSEIMLCGSDDPAVPDGLTGIRADAGAGLNRLCGFACENSLTGLEFAYGIPGTVGGAVYMNAGAYGGEIVDVIYAADILDVRTGEIRTVRLDDGGFGLSYRCSTFMDNGDIILRAYFALPAGDSKEIRAKMDDLLSRRKEKQPLDFPSAGSTFKRPEGYYAGKLIQDSGLRGFTVGGAQVSEKHCGFVINRGGATAADITALIDHIKKTVLEQQGVELECEVRIIPY